MKANRINLIAPVRAALIAGGYSTVKVVNAVNAELGKLGGIAGEEKAKLGNGQSRAKGFEYKVVETVTQSTEYTGKMTVPLLFDAWHGKQAAAFKVAEFDTVALPTACLEWLGKMKETDPVPNGAEVKKPVKGGKPEVKPEVPAAPVAA